jgi:hypothetical protein
MKTIIRFVGLCCFILATLTSCKFNDSSTDIPHNITENTEPSIEETSPGESDLIEIMPNDFSYNLLKPLVSSQGIINYRELELPSKINDLKMSMCRIYDKQRLLVLLYEDTPLSRSREIGFYDFEIKQYETLFTITLEDDQYDRSVSIIDIDDKYIVYRNTIYKELNDLLGTSALHVFNIETKSDIRIHEFPIDRIGNSSRNQNKAILYGDMLYYDEIVLTNGERTEVNLYQFDLQNESISLIQEWAQTPTVYQGELFFIAKDVASSDYYFQSLDTKTKIKLAKSVDDIAITGTDLYSTKLIDSYEKTKPSVLNIESLISEEELLTTTNAINHLKGNNEMLTWMNYYLEKPVVYLKSLDKFIIFDEIEKGYISYELSDEFGILVYNNDYNCLRYYIFTLNGSI